MLTSVTFVLTSIFKLLHIYTANQSLWGIPKTFAFLSYLAKSIIWQGTYSPRKKDIFSLFLIFFPDPSKIEMKKN